MRVVILPIIRFFWFFVSSYPIINYLKCLIQLSKKIKCGGFIWSPNWEFSYIMVKINILWRGLAISIIFDQFSTLGLFKRKLLRRMSASQKARKAGKRSPFHVKFEESGWKIIFKNLNFAGFFPDGEWQPCKVNCFCMIHGWRIPPGGLVCIRSLRESPMDAFNDNTKDL